MLPEIRKFSFDQFVRGKFGEVNFFHFFDLIHNGDQLSFNFSFLIFFELKLLKELLLEFLSLAISLF